MDLISLLTLFLIFSISHYVQLKQMHYSYFGIGKEGISFGDVKVASLRVIVLYEDKVVLREDVVNIHVSTRHSSFVFEMFFFGVWSVVVELYLPIE